MPRKSDLLRGLGWDDNLIRHFMIEDSGYIESEDSPYIAEVYDSNSMTVTFNSENVGSNFIVKMHNN